MATRTPTITLALPADTQDRLKELADRTQTSQAKVIESLLLLSDDQIVAQVGTAAPIIAQRKADRLRRKHEIAKKLAHLSPEDLDAVLAAASAERK